MYLGSTFRTTSGGRICCGGRARLRLAFREPHQPAPRKARHIRHLDRDAVHHTARKSRVRHHRVRHARIGRPFSELPARPVPPPADSPSTLVRNSSPLWVACPWPRLAPPGPARSTVQCDWRPHRPPPAVVDPPRSPRHAKLAALEHPSSWPDSVRQLPAKPPPSLRAPIGAAGGSAEMAGAASGFAGRLRGRKPRGTFSKPAFGDAKLATSGAVGKATAATACDFPAGATNVLGCGLGPASGNGSASGSTTIPGRGPSGSCSIACLCIRTSGGGVNARRGPLGVKSGSAKAAFTSAAAKRGASASGVASGAVTGFTDGATNGRTTFGEAAATTLGNGTGFTATVSGSGAQIRGAGCASSLRPATIVCGAFSRARAGRSSGSVRRRPNLRQLLLQTVPDDLLLVRADLLVVNRLRPRPRMPPASKCHPREHTAVHAGRYREGKEILGESCRDRPASCTTTPPAWARARSLAPVPSCARWRAAAADSWPDIR